MGDPQSRDVRPARETLTVESEHSATLAARYHFSQRQKAYRTLSRQQHGPHTSRVPHFQAATTAHSLPPQTHPPYVRRYASLLTTRQLELLVQLEAADLECCAMVATDGRPSILITSS